MLNTEVVDPGSWQGTPWGSLPHPGSRRGFHTASCPAVLPQRSQLDPGFIPKHGSWIHPGRTVAVVLPFWGQDETGCRQFTTNAQAANSGIWESLTLGFLLVSSHRPVSPPQHTHAHTHLPTHGAGQEFMISQGIGFTISVFCLSH